MCGHGPFESNMRAIHIYFFNSSVDVARQSQQAIAALVSEPQQQAASVAMPSASQVEAAFSVFLGSRLQYVACLAKTNGPVAAVRIAKAGAEGVAAVAQQLSVMSSLSHEVAIRLLDMIDNSALLYAHKGEIRTIIQAKPKLP